jgi:hypothetical protein
LPCHSSTHCHGAVAKVMEQLVSPIN